MSDERLRELERRWKESGAVEDQAAFLTERVRAGKISRTAIKTCALLGHEACRLVRMDWQAVEGLGSSRVDDVTGLYRLQTLPLQRGLQILTAALMGQHARSGRQYGVSARTNAWWGSRSPRARRDDLLRDLAIVLQSLARSKRQRASLQLAHEILDGTYPELAKAEMRDYRPRDFGEWHRRLMERALTLFPSHVDVNYQLLSREIEAGDLELVTVRSREGPTITSHSGPHRDISDAMAYASYSAGLQADVPDANQDLYTAEALQSAAEEFAAQQTSEDDEDEEGDT